MCSDDDHDPRSLAARIWEREWLRKLGLEDVPWEAKHCCRFCNRPRGKPGGRAQDIAHETAHDVEKDGPPSGTRTKTTPARTKQR